MMYSTRSAVSPVLSSNRGLPPAYIVSFGSPYSLRPSSAIQRSMRISSPLLGVFEANGIARARGIVKSASAARRATAEAANRMLRENARVAGVPPPRARGRVVSASTAPSGLPTKRQRS